MTKGLIRDTRAIDVRREGREEERLGFALENDDGTWTAFTTHPMKDGHPLLGNHFKNSRAAYRAIMEFEVVGDGLAEALRR